MAVVPDLVRLSELETQFDQDPRYTQHVYHSSEPGRRRVRIEERWRTERELGRGAFGDVHLERCVAGTKEGTLRAVKKISTKRCNKYLRELEAIALFSHPKYASFFVKSFGWYQSQDNIFISMEYLPNGDLQQHLQAPLPECQAQLIISQILEGLDFMHDHGFTHRDLKPSNILVVDKGPQWWVKIADFGISKRADDGLRSQIGTLAFTAPEVLGYVRTDNGSQDSYTSAVDVWSTGVITFFIMTGVIAFADLRLLSRYVFDKAQFPSEILRSHSITVSGCDFTKALMEPTPGHRPPVKELLRHSWLEQKFESTPSSPRGEIVPTGKPVSRSPDPLATWGTKHTRTEPKTAYLEPSAEWTTKASLPTLESSNTVDADANTERTPRNSATAEFHHGHTVLAVAISPDGKLLASSSKKGHVISDIVTKAVVKRIHNNGSSHPGHSLKFSPNGRSLAIRTDSAEFTLWDTLVWNTTWKLVLGASADKINRAVLYGLSGCAVAFSPDSQLLVVSFGSPPEVWDVETGMMISKFQSTTGPETTVLSHSGLVFSPDGRFVAWVTLTGTLQLWDIRRDTKTQRTQINLVHSIAFSESGHFVTIADAHGRAKILETKSGITVQAKIISPNDSGLERSKADFYLFSEAVVSTHGTHVAFGSRDGRVLIWDSVTGAILEKRLHDGYLVSAIAFSSDDRMLAVGYKDGYVVLWDWLEEMVQAKPLVDGTPIHAARSSSLQDRFKQLFK